MITLEDLARQAGVSHSTVSRALADSPLVNAATKERIQNLARESGYQVNQVARNLKTRSTQTIGLVVPEVSNPFYPELIQRVADAAKLAGYSLQLHLSAADQESEGACIASLAGSRADGILLVTGERGLVARSQINSVRAAGTPVVIMGWVEDAGHLDLVAGDDAAGGRELAHHLADLGHTRIAVLGKALHRGAYDRMVGFTEVLKSRNIPLLPEMSIEVKTEKDVREGVSKLLSLPAPPTAIFAYQDSLAAVVYRQLEEEGVSIPRDMTVVGFDNLDLATYLSPQLTTVGNHISPLSSAFVSLLVARIQGTLPDPAPQSIIVTPHLIIRASSAPPSTPLGFGDSI
jgi:LacI family transcriptional regulator